MEVKLKINGKPIIVDTDKLDKTWIDYCLMYGIRRYPNDQHSGLNGNDKFVEVQKFCLMMQNGEPMPQKVATVSTTNPIDTLAFKTATADLVAILRKVTDKTKAIEFAEHDAGKLFFTIKDGSAIWNKVTVSKWIAKQKESGKRDYVADAIALLEPIEGENALDIEPTSASEGESGSESADSHNGNLHEPKDGEASGTRGR